MSLFSMLGSAASNMAVFESAMSVTQNNVANSSTAGYARQIATFEAQSFDLANGNQGGVHAGPVEDTRNQYLEQSVRDATTQLGTYEQQVNSLTPLQNYFDISAASGVPAALSTMFSDFSSWATNPSNTTSQQSVISQAQNVAAAFNTTAGNISQATINTNSQLSSLVDKVNSLVTKLSGYNAQIEAGSKSDPGLQASLNSTLQDLSEVANITTATQPDGAIEVMLGSQTMLLSGTRQNALSVSYGVPSTPAPSNPLGPPDAKLTDSYGADVTASASGGQLGGLLYVRNQVLPSIQGNGSQTGSLNQLAKSFADQVNSVIGFPLFTYDSTDATRTAASLKLSSTASIANLPAARITALTGSAIPSPLTITPGSNDGLNLQVDGKTWPTITLNPADNSASTIAADLNTQFTTLGIGASATVSSSGALILSTKNTTASASIAILSGTSNATLGLTTPTATYQNAANSIASILANLVNSVGSGQITALTGTALNSAVTITPGVNDSLHLVIDGKTWPPFKLNSADNSAASIVADLNTQFGTLGIGAQASVSGSGGLVLSTTNTGSSGSISILSGTANTSLGLAQTTPTYQNGIAGQTFTAYFGSIAADVGSALSQAQASQTASQSAVTQAESIRQQVSGVDLNTEAATLLQLQSAYQAASKLVTVINNLTTTALNLIGNPVS